MSINQGYTHRFTAKWSNALVFAFYWVLLFILYLPAANAGRVGDFPGWVNFLNANNFVDYINRKGSGIPSLYQFTQIITYCFYKVFGVNTWCWHLLYISIQAINALLLFILFRKLFSNSKLLRPQEIAFGGALLFCLTPCISEVVVWEPSFHYLLGLMLMLLVLICAQKFMSTSNARHAWMAGIVFFLSSFSLEVFYLTPLFVFTLGLYYAQFSAEYKGTFRRLLWFFILPQVAIFALHLLSLRLLYHSGIAHVGSVAIQFNAANISKGLKYIFHILFLGRFFNDSVRSSIYHFAESIPGLLLFYGLAVGLLIVGAVRFGSLANKYKSLLLVSVWLCFATGLLLPLWFPDTGLVIYDRYTYVLDAFLLMWLSLVLHNMLTRKWFVAVLLGIVLINVRFTHKVNAYWQQSAHIVNNLLERFPNNKSKKVLLVNLPECLGGVQMIGTRDDGEFKAMYNSIMPEKIGNVVYDVEAFYMSSPADGAHVTVVDDSTIKVTLNQWGTWWIYYGYGATSYENADYKVIMRDMGHWYDLILKHPADQYLVLYCIGDQWKVADLNRKNVDQY